MENNQVATGATNPTEAPISATPSEVQPATPESSGTPSTEQSSIPEADRYAGLSNKPVSEWNLKDDDIKNPKFAEHLEQLRQGHLRMDDYTRKTQEIADLRRKYEGGADIYGKQWTTDEIVKLATQNQTFLRAATEAAQSQQNISEMTDEQRKLYELQNTLSSQQQKIQQWEQAQYMNNFNAQIDSLDKKYGGTVKPVVDKIQGLMVGSVKQGLSPEGAFKAFWFEEYGKKMKEEGIKEGMNRKNEKLSKQLPSGPSNTSNSVASPTSAKSIDAITKQLRAEHSSRKR